MGKVTASSVDGTAEVSRPGSTTIATVERAVDVLMHFTRTDAPDLGVTEIAQELALPKGAVHRALTTLRNRDLVTLDPHTRRYSLGVAALRLGTAFLSRVDVRASARPVLVELSRRTEETATLSVPLGARARVYVDQVLPDREVLMSVTQGEAVELHAGASSHALLAFQAERRVESYLEHAQTVSLLGDDGLAYLRNELALVRSQGWAFSVGERRAGTASVAAPVRDHAGDAVAVVSVCGPAERIIEHLGTCRESLLEATDELSRGIGWREA